MTAVICAHLEWFNWLWVVFAALAVVFWLRRGEGPRAPLLFLLAAALLTGLFLLSALPEVGFWFRGLLWIPMVGAPVLVGIAFAMARGARLFVVATAFALLTAVPIIALLVGYGLQCPQMMSD